MSYRDDTVALRHMLEHARRAAMLAAREEPDVLRDMALQQLVSMVGDSARRASEGVRNRHPAIEWGRLSQEGDRLREEYDRIDNAILRQRVRDRFSRLIELLEAALATESARPTPPPPKRVGLRIVPPTQKIAELCRKHHVRRLAFFGSVLRADFGAESDVDVLVEFEPGRTPGFAFYALQEELSAVVGRRVDLKTPNDLSPYLRERILAEAEPLFVAA